MAVFAIPYATQGLALDVIHGQTAISGMWFGLLAGRLGTLLLRGNLDGRVLSEAFEAPSSVAYSETNIFKDGASAPGLSDEEMAEVQEKLQGWGYAG